MVQEPKVIQSVILRPNKKIIRIFGLVLLVFLVTIYHVFITPSGLSAANIKDTNVFQYLNDLGKPKQHVGVQDQGIFGEVLRAGKGQEFDDPNKQNQTEAGTQRDGKERAALIIIIQNKLEVPQLMPTIRNYQEKFNDKYQYDWVIISHRSMLKEFREDIASISGGESTVKFIDIKYLGDFLTYPEGTDRNKVKENRRNKQLPDHLRRKNTLQSRQLARFMLGHFYNLDSIWKDYDYYWKVPVGSQLGCDVSYDVFKHMRENNIKYGWLLMQNDYIDELHPSLFNHVKNYILDSSNNFMSDLGPTLNGFHFLLDDKNDNVFENPEAEWKLRPCSFDSSFELADVSFFKSKQYQHYFNYLDDLRGIYYETWGEPVIKTIAASLFLDKNQVKFFDDLAVAGPNARANCPVNSEFYLQNKCSCDPNDHGKEEKVSGVLMTTELMYKSECVSGWLQSLNLPAPKTFELGDEPLFEDSNKDDEISHHE